MQQHGNRSDSKTAEYRITRENQKTGLKKEFSSFSGTYRNGTIFLDKGYYFYYPDGSIIAANREQKQIRQKVKDTTTLKLYDKDNNETKYKIDTSSLYKPPIAPQEGLILPLTTLAAKAVPSNMNSSEVSLLSPPARDEILQHRHGAPELQAKVLAAKFNENRAMKKELREKSNRLAFHISPSSPLTKGLTWVRSLTNAATNIQRIFRGFRVRQELKRLENSTRNGN